MNDTKSLLELTSQCVRCGLCLPHCPTYQLNQAEPESPRGRIALLAASAQAEVSFVPSIQQHIDNCLACGHCERVCPAGVQYNTLLIAGRAHLNQVHPISWRKKIGITLVETPILRNACYGMIRCLQKLRLWNSCIAVTALLSKKIARAMKIIPLKKKLSSRSRDLIAGSVRGTQAFTLGKVLLFPGCSGHIFNQDTLHAAKNLLAVWGYDWIEPPSALCCGALSAHAGLSQRTMQRSAQHLAPLCAKQKISHILMIATGCSSFAKNFTSVAPSLHVLDIQQFLLDHWPTTPLHFKKNLLRIGVHSPCTQTNGLNNPQLSYALLSRLPNVVLIPFGENTCCGASGTYFLEHPEKSNDFAKQLLTQQLLSKCDIIVTSNIGCQLHFQNFFRQQGLFMKICHPIEILLHALC